MSHRIASRFQSLRSVVLVSTVTILLDRSPSLGADYTLVGWNNLGMHCMDADYSVFSLLPPYNTIHAQLIDPQGNLVSNPANLSVTYQATADPDGSSNTTSFGKTNFWEHLPGLFGASLPTDVGLTGVRMPGLANQPQPMTYDNANGWFVAEGIPITPYDDQGRKNPYPLMRLVARDGGGALLASTDIVLPVSDEMDCRSCHGSGSRPETKPSSDWANDPDPQRDFRINILRLHDDRQAGSATFDAALAGVGYDPAGLAATVVGGKSILCASCHASAALGTSGQTGVPALTQSMHSGHANATDPSTQLALGSSDNRTACYRCHPGSSTRCLRGAMGAAVAGDGTMAMQCQSCHGGMTDVGAPTRSGWLEEPSCQNCHTGTATHNNGQIRFQSVFDAPGHNRVAVDSTFATSVDAPAAGLSLYRFSTGHGGLKCEACHGSTHAEFPSSHRNDNLASLSLQGHEGMLVECDSCHPGQPPTIAGGPHGMHPVGQAWVSQHPDAVEGSGSAACRSCHGADYRGTVLSRVKGDRVLNAFGSKLFWRGMQVGCYSCHQGPNNDDSNPNHPAVVSNASVVTGMNMPVLVGLSANDSDRNPLTLRIVSQPSNGTAGLSGTQATYYPFEGFTGADHFTVAAWDGSVDSNLASVDVVVGRTDGCTYIVLPNVTQLSSSGGTVTLQVQTAAGCLWTAVANDPWLSVSQGATGSGNGSVVVRAAANPGSQPRRATVLVAGQAIAIDEAGVSTPLPDLTASWTTLTQMCRGEGSDLRCSLKGKVAVRNQGSASAGRSTLAVYLSADTTLGPNDLAVGRVRKLKALAAQDGVVSAVHVRLPRGTSATGMHVLAASDAAQVIGESDESNNLATYGPLF